MSNFSSIKKSALGNTTANNKKTATERKISLAALYMIVYPVVYIIVTLPLAAGRIASMAGNKPSLQYLLVGGCFMTSAGWIDCLLYTFTRRAFLTTNSSTVIKGLSRGQRSDSKSCPNEKDGDIELSADVEGPMSRYRGIPSQGSSSDHIMHNAEDMGITSSCGGVKVETTWEVMTQYRSNEMDVNRL